MALLAVSTNTVKFVENLFSEGENLSRIRLFMWDIITVWDGSTAMSISILFGTWINNKSTLCWIHNNWRGFYEKVKFHEWQNETPPSLSDRFGDEWFRHIHTAPPLKVEKMLATIKIVQSLHTLSNSVLVIWCAVCHIATCICNRRQQEVNLSEHQAGAMCHSLHKRFHSLEDSAVQKADSTPLIRKYRTIGPLNDSPQHVSPLEPTAEQICYYLIITFLPSIWKWASVTLMCRGARCWHFFRRSIVYLSTHWTASAISSEKSLCIWAANTLSGRAMPLRCPIPIWHSDTHHTRCAHWLYKIGTPVTRIIASTLTDECRYTATNELFTVK